MKRREKKKREKKKRLEHGRLQNKQRLDRVLSALGLLQEFRKLPSPVRRLAIESLPSKPEVYIDPAAVGLPDMVNVKAEIEQALERTGVQTSEGRLVPLSEFLSTCGALAGVFAPLREAPLPRKTQPLAVELAERTGTFYKDHTQLATGLLVTEVVMRLVVRSRVDQGVYGCLFEPQDYRPGRALVRLTLSYSEPREARVDIDGHVRRTFQCGLPLGLNGILWADGDGADFGLPGGSRYPMFIQPHALQRLRERLPLGALAEEFIQFGLLGSLTDPNVVERQDRGYLIEFALRGLRVGYLVAQVVQGKIVITTFLFLTMKGTPEHRLLSQKLGLSRRDIEYEGLDRIETFLSPDVRADSRLVELLEQCGCGSLLTLGREVFPNSPAGSRAEELRRFLRIKEGGDRTLFKRLSPPLSRVG